jgi:hypothetical protein
MVKHDPWVKKKKKKIQVNEFLKVALECSRNYSKLNKSLMKTMPNLCLITMCK